MTDPASLGTEETTKKETSGRDDATLTALRVIERAMLILVGLMTLLAVALELWSIGVRREVSLADILLMFLYTEVIGMVAVFYASRRIVVIYPIFIAITALARLIVLQGKDMDPLNIVFEAAAILILGIAVILLSRVRQPGADA